MPAAGWQSMTFVLEQTLSNFVSFDIEYVNYCLASVKFHPAPILKLRTVFTNLNLC